MAFTLMSYPISKVSLLVKLASFALLVTCSQSFKPKNINVSMFNHSYGSDDDWSPAGATWYGSPTGAGSDGGACGYRNTVGRPPFSGMITSAGPSLYQSGEGCGDCYEVKCTGNDACSGNPVTVTITDECPGCTSEAAHFDLSGTAFGAMAKPNRCQDLRNVGLLNVQYKRVDCIYRGETIVVTVDQGSNGYYFACTIEYENGFGIQKVDIKQQSGDWSPMDISWGADWKIEAGYDLQPPFSLRLTEEVTGKNIILDNVIPVGWQPGKSYRSRVNFD